MSDKNGKDEELISRRKFFKNSAKAVLPFLGVVTFGPAILSSCSKDDDGYYDDCTGNACGSLCLSMASIESSHNNKDNNNSGGDDDDDDGSCKQCKSTCEKECMTTCELGAETSFEDCHSSCKGECKSSCRGTCMGTSNIGW